MRSSIFTNLNIFIYTRIVMKIKYIDPFFLVPHLIECEISILFLLNSAHCKIYTNIRSGVKIVDIGPSFLVPWHTKGQNV